MRNHRDVFTVALVAMFFLLAACSVNVRKNENGQDKKVDIDTPFGGIHVSKGADVRDTGLAVYPGARLKPKENSEDTKSANVDISTSAFGLRVVALEYLSDDAPAKVTAYYKDQLKQYGTVLECHTEGHHYRYSHSDKNDDALKCEGDDRGNTIELKVGTEHNQHVVAITPDDKGTDFALVYVRIRGEEGTI
jgi:hypothetical protein